ncbi:N-6 DNA methylase [Paraliobacillus sp. X-1268]|uniref:Eco57I restriction-modification methylase domain-containing protein n=1 Tax=Paraliobacillus sp. X-1268 TaxID=2213193 RepID=UPI000E3BC805|nr:N-6 DNA methylase [Paraliobacillus sp. X-1268]
MEDKSFLLEDVKKKIILKKDITKEILTLNSVLFDNRKKIYLEIDSSEIYEETISIITDILFIFLSTQRNLTMFEIDNSNEELTQRIKVIVSELGSNNVMEEIWNEQVQEIINNLNNYFKKNIISVDILGVLVEDSGEKNEATVMASKNGSSQHRREMGSYYTKTELIDVIVNKTIDSLCENKSIDEILQLKVVDPAVGAGAFLLAALNRILYHIEKNHSSFLSNEEVIKYKRKIAENILYGVDINWKALKAAKYSLWLEVGDRELPIELIGKNLVEGDSLLGSHWDLNNIKSDEEAEALNSTNYYVVGKLIMGEKVDNWLDIYKDFLESDHNRQNIDNEAIIRGKESKTFIWQLEFQDVYAIREGFDAVIGNPPWNKIKAHLKEFFEHYDVKIKGMQGDEQKKYIDEYFLSNEYYKNLWNNHKSYIKEYSDAVNNSPHFSYQTSVVNGKRLGGDRDLFKYFLELAYNLCRKNGYVGLILPASIIQSEGTTGLRNLLFNHNKIDLLITVENRDKIFPIDSRFKYSLLVFNKTKTADKYLKCRFMLKSINEVQECIKNDSLLDLPKDLLDILSPDYKSLPDLKSQFEIGLIKKVYEAHPLINSPKGWKLQIFRELDMTNDSNLFVKKQSFESSIEEKVEFIPLYEGRMVNQYDFAAKKYMHGEGRQAKWSDLDWDNKNIHPHYYVKKSDAELKFPNYTKARPCYCDIAGQTNERAVQTALLPKEVIAGNKVPTIKLQPDNIANNLIWIAIANSFVFDWLMRLRMSTTINFFHWNQMPLPIIDTHSDEGIQLVKNAARLSLASPVMDDVRKDLIEFYNGDLQLNDIKPSIKPIDRQEIRANTDALVAKIYGFTKTELAYILHQFPLLDRKQPSLPNDKSVNNNRSSSFITRDLVLHQFLEIKNQKKTIDVVELFKLCGLNIDIITGDIRLLNERILAAKELGAIAYITG